MGGYRSYASRKKFGGEVKLKIINMQREITNGKDMQIRKVNGGCNIVLF